MGNLAIKVGYRAGQVDLLDPLSGILRLSSLQQSDPFCTLGQNGRVQTKLRINTPGDAFEQEADRVAEHVMSMPESPAFFCSW